jgi:hypothetical protein
VREKNCLPILPLPSCAPAIHIKQFNKKHFHTRPDTSNIQLYWQSPLGKCLWNARQLYFLHGRWLELGLSHFHEEVMQNSFGNKIDIYILIPILHELMLHHHTSRTTPCAKAMCLASQSITATTVKIYPSHNNSPQRKRQRTNLIYETVE